MILDGVNAGEKIAGVSAVLLLVSMFLSWFVVSIPESLGVDFFAAGTGQSAWDALDYTPIALTIGAALVLILAALRLLGRGVTPPPSTGRVVAVLGIGSALLILFRIIDPPSLGSFQGVFGVTAAAEGTVGFGIFVGLLAALGIAVGGCVAMKEESARSPTPRRGGSKHQAHLHLREHE